MLLAGKTALITGASRGIGRAIAHVFAKQGATLFLTARSEQLFEVKEELEAQGAKVFAQQCDITDEASVKDMIKACRKELKPLDILVNNAGIMKAGLVGMTSMGDVRDMLDVNVTSAINITQYAVRLMARAESASIIHITSIAGMQGIEGVSAYAASKLAIVGYMRASAKELAPRNIRVNSIAPGFIDTDMTRSMDDEWFQKRVESVRMGRIGKPEDIANCALFLASDLSNYVTGQIIGVDGGMIA
ncbi:MAG: 3-oxoacyl-ACP reductase [Deltaproteobacteria bacterium]|nr:3-oxoacyl-ACP reductase [Deltaproteobacteria bacterium]MBK05263.1 3-oxoacyl-ACP reductase [Deltaproteobacteria bacterium]|tara:strand:- start:4206 stop:4943 length:738 start_codon:yes stop_codon:yes gene_type:complete